MSGKPAARVSDPTACPIPGHSKNPITAGSPNVLFDNLAAARQDDPTACGSSLASGVISNVLINGKPATTVGTLGNHGNPVVAGSGTVIIGNSGGGAAFTAPTPLAIAEGFDQLFSVEAENGQPLDNLTYRVVSATGRKQQGSTCASGLTNNFSTGSQKENLTIYLSGD